MADYNLGTAKGVIEIEYKGDGAKQAREDIDQTRDSSQKAGGALDKYGKKAGVAGLVLAGGFALAAKTASSFEQGMSQVAAVAGASAEEMDQLREKALQLGKDTSFSANESANAMEELAKAGVSATDILEGAADAAVALAAAGQVDMATAASIASAAMNSFSLEAKDATRVADLMAGAANKSATDVVGVGEAFKYVAPLAANTGVSIEDTTTAIAALAKVGINGSQAGTTLRAMLQNLNPASQGAADAMKELGIITEDGTNRFFDASGNTRSMAEISGVLAESLSGLSDEQKSQALTTIFGARAMTGAIALAKQGEKGFNELGESIGSVSAADVAATRMDNLAGSVEEMMGSLETLAITVGEKLIPFIRDLADGATKLLDVFLDLPGGVQTAIVVFMGIVTASLLAVGAFVKIVNFLKAVKAAFLLVKGAAIPAWLAALGPIALVIAAIAAVVAIIVLLWKKSETFRTIVLAVWGAIKTAAKAVADWFTGSLVPALQSAWDGIVAGLTWVKDLFVTIWDAIVLVITTVFDTIATAVSFYINMWKTVISTGLAVIGAAWSAFWGVFGGVIKAAWNLVTAIIEFAWTLIKGIFLMQLKAVLMIVRTAWNAIVQVFRTTWNIIKRIVQVGANFVRAIVARVWGAIRAATSAAWNGIMKVIRAVWDRIGGTVMGAVNRVKSGVSGAWDAVRSTTTRVWDQVREAIKSALDRAVNLVSGLKDRVLAPLKGAGTWLYNAGKEIVQGLINGIESLINKPAELIRKGTAGIGKLLPGSPVKEGPLTVLNRGYAGKQIVQMVIDGIQGMQGPMEQTMANVIALPNLSEDLGRIHTASTLPTPAPRMPSGGPNGGAGVTNRPQGLRLVEGKLSIDKSGRAWIRGVAEDVVDGNERFNMTYERMGG